MEKISYPCPCGGKLEWKTDKVIVSGINCGILDTEYCKKCGEIFYDSSAADEIQKKSRELVLFGLSKNTKVA